MRNILHHRNCVSGAAIAIAALQGAAVQAQEVSASNALDNDAIVVTARRAAENIQSTPVSITAFNADTLRSASIE